MTRVRPTLQEAVRWIAENDEPLLLEVAQVEELISVMLIADLFGKTPQVVAGLVVNHREAHLDEGEPIREADAGVAVQTRPKYPEIVVQLSGQDGNAFGVMGAVVKALKAAKTTKEERDTFMQEATRGDYNELLATCMRWVVVQ